MFGPRLLAFIVDGVLADLVSILTGQRPGETGYGLVGYLVFLGIELLFVSVGGQTPGMRLAGIAVVRARDGGKPAVGWVAVRTLLLAAVVPALIPDSAGRCMHDRAAGTTIVRTRP